MPGVAAHLAHALRLAGVADPEGVDWAREAYAWAEANARPGDEPKRPAPAPFRAYEARILADNSDVSEIHYLRHEARYGPWLYALTHGDSAPTAPDAAARARITAAVLHSSDETRLATSARRALRRGDDFSMPMPIGQQTTPWVLEGAVGHQLHQRRGDTEKARRTLAALLTTCGYSLGTNSHNLTGTARWR
jgi:hypothetical protein